MEKRLTRWLINTSVIIGLIIVALGAIIMYFFGTNLWQGMRNFWHWLVETVFWIMGWSLLSLYLSALLNIFRRHSFIIKKSFVYKITWPLSNWAWHLGKKLKPNYLWDQALKKLVNFFIISGVILLITSFFLIFAYFQILLHLFATLGGIFILILAYKYFFYLKNKYLMYQINKKVKNERIKEVERKRKEKEETERLNKLNLFEMVQECLKNKDDDAFQLLYCNILAEKMTKESLSAKEKAHLAQRLGSLSAKECQDFLPNLINLFAPQDWEILLTTRGNWQPIHDLPLLFKFSSYKKEVIENFLQADLPLENLWSKTKKEFRRSFFVPKIFGLINALQFSYKKDWDEEHIANLVKKMETLFQFMADSGASAWDDREKESVYRFIEICRQEFKNNGLQVKIPRLSK